MIGRVHHGLPVRVLPPDDVGGSRRDPSSPEGSPEECHTPVLGFEHVFAAPDPRGLSDASLRARLDEIERSVRALEAERARCLAEVERRRLHASEGQLSPAAWLAHRYGVPQGARLRRCGWRSRSRRCRGRRKRWRADAGGDLADLDEEGRHARRRFTVVVTMDAPSVPLEVGRATKVVSPALRRALAVRDGGCRFPGCERPPGWCDGPRPRSAGGPQPSSGGRLNPTRGRRRAGSSQAGAVLPSDPQDAPERPAGRGPSGRGPPRRGGLRSEAEATPRSSPWPRNPKASPTSTPSSSP